MPDEPISIACPHCSVRMKLKDSAALGKTIKCPKCGQSFAAKAPATVGAAAAGAVKKKRPAAEAPPPDADDEDEEPPEEPKKKKKKKKKRKKSSGVPLPLILGLSAFFVMLVVGGVVVAIVASKGSGGGSRAAAVTVPELETYQGQVFSFLAPKGWKKEDGGAENHQWVEFTSGSIKVRANDDSAGVGDIISGPGRGERMADHRLEVIHHVHLGKAETLKEDYGDYKEEEPVPFDAKLPGPGRWSAFSGTEGTLFKAKIRGIRATVQSATKTVVLRCTCPESQWEAFKPVFEKIVTSVGPGRRL